MKMVKSLLLGTAAGIATVTAGQAADMPVKARPVEYVKVCSLYGDGFWYIPGTDTCIKLGGFVRAQFSWNAGNNAQPYRPRRLQRRRRLASIPAQIPVPTFNYIGVISIDARTPTDYGTLRSYMDLGTQSTSAGRFGGAMSGLSVLGSIPTPVNSGNLIAGTSATPATTTSTKRPPFRAPSSSSPGSPLAACDRSSISTAWVRTT